MKKAILVVSFGTTIRETRQANIDVLEQEIQASVQRTEQGSYVSMNPQVLQGFLQNLNKQLTRLGELGYAPVMLTSPAVRPYVRKLTERCAPALAVLSYAEVDPKVEVQAVGMVTI